MRSTQKRSKYADPGASAVRYCEEEGCAEQGQYRAPKSRDHLHEYRWLCLEHVKEHNKKWDFFADMSMEEIEGFMKDAVTGHRPTWEREDRRSRYAHYANLLHEELYYFFHGRKPPAAEKPAPALTARERRALATLELEAPCDEAQLKIRYRLLVKRHHPDLHKGDKAHEAKFKEITAAYTYLQECRKRDQS